MIDDEEERKRRLEEARNIISNTSNLRANTSNNNLYNQRLQEANSIINSINPSKTREITEEERQNSINNANSFMNLLDKNSTSEVTPSKMIITDTNSSDILKTSDELEKEKDEKTVKELKANTNIVTAKNNNNGNNAISNFRASQNFNNTASEEDKSLWNVIVDEFKREIDTIAGIGGNFVLGATDTFTSPANWIQAFETWGEKTATEQLLKLVGYSEEDAKKAGEIVEENSKNSIYAKLNTLYTNNPEIKQWKNKTIQENIEKASGNPVTKYLAELAPSIGSNIVPMAVSAVNPVLGSALFMLQAGGSYLDDAKARGMSDDEALGYATIMGILEGGSEAVITGSMVSKIGKALIGKGLSKEVLNSWGVNIIENFAQEAIMEPLQEATATITGGIETADWDNMLNRMLKAGFWGIVSSIILGGSSAGIASAQKILNETNLTTDDYAQAVMDTINSGKVDVQGIVQGAQEAIINNGGTQQFYTTTFNQDGNVENVQAVRGKEIDNPNSKVNMAPVIIRNENNAYNIIDKNTGILLDSTPYTSLIETQAQFNEKMINLDNAAINNINNKIAQATVAIDNKMNEVSSNIDNENVENTSQSGPENVMNDTQTGANNVNVTTNTSTDTLNSFNINTDAYQAPQNQFIGDYNNDMTNYVSNNANTPTSQNNGLQDVSRLLSQISDNSIYNTEKASQAFRTVARNIPAIELQVNEDGYSLNSLNKNGDVVYSQKLSGRPYRGARIKQIINNAISNADVSNTNTTQTNENGFRDISDNETVNYVSESRRENIGQNNEYKKGGNENVERKQSNSNNEQKANREQKTNDRKGTSSNGQSNESIEEKLSISLQNYAEEKSKLIGQKVKANIVNNQNYSKNEQIVSDGFKKATGLDVNIYETNIGTSESAFYSESNIFLKHNAMASKKATNFKPYHELGHWIRNNYNSEWDKLYNIINDTITSEQIEQYKNVLNDKTVFNNMSQEEVKDYVINEIISDYIGNWSNNIINWEQYIVDGTLSQEYADFLADISLENEITGYNVFGSIEQQEQMYDEIGRIIYDVVSNRVNNANRNNTENVVKYSNRADVILDKDGKFNRVRINEDIFANNIGNKSISKIIHDYLTKHIGEYYYIFESGQKVYLGKDLPGEYAYSKSSKSLLITEKLAKGRAASGLQQIIENATNKRHEMSQKAKHKSDAKYGFYKYDTRFSFVQNGRENIYEGTVLIRNDADGKKYLYDILGIKKVGSNLPPVASNSKKSSARFGGSNSLPSSNSIAQINPSVKSNSTTTNTNNTQNNKKNSSKIKKSDRDLNEDNQAQTEYDKKVQQDNKKVAKLIKERSFFKNVYNSNVSEEFKKELLKHRKDYQYEPISNKQTLENASKKVENVKNIRDEFMQNDLKEAEDTAIGELLIHKAIEAGDYEEANTLTAALADKLTTAGQTIQAAAMFHRMTPEGTLLYAQRQVNKINKELRDKFKLNRLITKKNAPQIELTEEKIQHIMNLAKQIQELEDMKKNITTGDAMETIERKQDELIAGIVAKVGEDVPVTMLDKVTAWRNISLLLNPKTVVRNIVSNSMFCALENVTDVVGVPIDKAISFITGQRSLLMPSIKTQSKGFKKGFEYAVEDTKQGISTSLGGNKYEIKPNKNFKNKYLQALETASYFGVEGMDRPFMQGQYDGALKMIMELEGLTYGRDIPTTEMKDEALRIAQYRTFKDKNAISDFLSKVKKSLNLGKSIGAADVIGLTYTNIPGNLTKKTIDYSPLGLYNILQAYKQLKTNKMNGESTRQAQRELVQSVSRTLVGSGIMAVSMQAFLAGVITASGDDEDDRITELTGKENYAINIHALIRWLTGDDTTPQNGDLYITYSNYEPLSAIISAAAEMMGAAEQGDDAGTVAYKGITTWLNTIAELSTLSNFSNLFEFGDLGGSIIRSISQFPSSFIPTFLKQIAQFFEPTSKSNYSDNYIEKNIINPMKQRIPWLNSTLESNYDTMGNEKKSYNGSTGLGRIYDVFLNTSYTSTVDMNSTEQEIYDLYVSTGLTDHLPLTVKNSFTYKGEKITLTTKEKAEYQKELGERTAKAYKERMQTKEYQNLTDEEKVKDLANILSDLQIEVRGEVVLEPRGLAYDSRFTPSLSSLSYNGYKLNLTQEMQQEYEKIASDLYNQYANQGIYSEEYLEKLKEKVKDAAKKEMVQKYKSQLVK